MSKILVCVDAENISAKKYGDSILKGAKSFDEPIEYIACGKQKHLKGWRKISHFEYIEVDVGPDKADEKLISEILERTERGDTVIICANDKHFLYPYKMLKQWGRQITIWGTENAAKELKDQCEFVLIEPSKSKIKQKLLRLLNMAFTRINQEWVDLGLLGKTLREIDPTFQNNDYGNAQLSKILKKLSEFIELDGQKARLII